MGAGSKSGEQADASEFPGAYHWHSKHAFGRKYSILELVKFQGSEACLPRHTCRMSNKRLRLQMPIAVMVHCIGRPVAFP